MDEMTKDLLYKAVLQEVEIYNENVKKAFDYYCEVGNIKRKYQAISEEIDKSNKLFESVSEYLDLEVTITKRFQIDDVDTNFKEINLTRKK